MKTWITARLDGDGLAVSAAAEEAFGEAGRTAVGTFSPPADAEEVIALHAALAALLATYAPQARRAARRAAALAYSVAIGKGEEED